LKKNEQPRVVRAADQIAIRGVLGYGYPANVGPLHDLLPNRLTSAAVAGVLTLAMFGTAVTIAITGSPSRATRPPLHRPSIVEPPAPAPREQIVAQAAPTPAALSAPQPEQMDVAQPVKRREPLNKKAARDFHVTPTAKGTVLRMETRNHPTAAARVLGGGAVNNPSATESATTPVSAIPAASTITPSEPAFVGDSEPRKTEVATAAPNVAAASATAKLAPVAAVADPASATPAPVVVASATPAPAATTRGGSAGSWCFFTSGNGSHFVLNCSEVTAVRAPLEHEYRPEIQSVMSVGRGVMTARESVETVRQTVLSHGGHV
jgi:hypothetical protein